MFDICPALWHFGVSRCPDMEGIETSLHIYLSQGTLQMSVGAPTWRGLKLCGLFLSSDVLRMCQ